ncbi:hypothetical protein QBC41DRAFT_51893 [Cercophora samala]|uniref:Uncharacterized protein n=1 Tax=Cercophora samala TaxID=330535 RepID=A0AA39ZN43_9PEZI|nr:hypothetical protein QBC41DRAFT_51893 [Cercophora samala]
MSCLSKVRPRILKGGATQASRVGFSAPPAVVPRSHIGHIFRFPSSLPVTLYFFRLSACLSVCLSVCLSASTLHSLFPIPYSPTYSLPYYFAIALFIAPPVFSILSLTHFYIPICSRLTQTPITSHTHTHTQTHPQNRFPCTSAWVLPIC